MDFSGRGMSYREKWLMGAFIVLVVVAFVVYLPFAIFEAIRKGSKEEQQRLSRQNASRELRRLRYSKKEDYEFLLNELETQPNNPKIRRRCLEVGREYARLVREDGAETTFDELSIKNDIDAACAAGSITSENPAEDYQLVLPSEVVEATNAEPARPIAQTKRKTSKVAWGCLLLLLAPCIIGALTNPAATVVKNYDQVARSKVQPEAKPKKAISSESPKHPVVAEAVPKTKSKIEEEHKKAAKRKSLTWGSLFAGIEKLGFRPSVKWKKSKVDPGWIGIYHWRNDVSNEVSLLIEGETGKKISKVTVEAEVYEKQHRARTIKNGIACLSLLEAPTGVIEAFRSEKNAKVGTWQITRRSHPKGGGYDIEATRTYGRIKTKAGSKVEPAAIGVSFVNKYRQQLTSRGLTEEMFPKLSAKGNKVTITVVHAWSEMDYNSRFEAATILYKLWALVASPDSPDLARISIRTEGGTEIGGSRVWAGSLIWVQE